MPSPLSNAACVSIDLDNIIILGGGSDDGFSDKSLKLNTKSENITILKEMKDGRDLRNKIFKY